MIMTIIWYWTKNKDFGTSMILPSTKMKKKAFVFVHRLWCKWSNIRLIYITRAYIYTVWHSCWTFSHDEIKHGWHWSWVCLCVLHTHCLHLIVYVCDIFQKRMFWNLDDKKKIFWMLISNICVRHFILRCSKTYNSLNRMLCVKTQAEHK